MRVTTAASLASTFRELMLSQKHAEGILSRLGGTNYRWCGQFQGERAWKTVKCRTLTADDLRNGPVAIKPDRDVAHFAALDIDKGSRNHPSHDGGLATRDIRQMLRENDLESFVIQSSESTGLHIWVPLPPQSTTALSNWLQAQAYGAGFLVKNGLLELFPSPSLQALRVPLTSKGSVVLDEEFRPLHADAGAFLALWDHCLNHNQGFEKLAGQQRFFRSIPEASDRLRLGFTDKAQTDDIAQAAAYIARSEGLYGANLQRRMCGLISHCKGFREYSSHQRAVRKGTLDKWWRYYSNTPLPEHQPKPSRWDFDRPRQPNQNQALADQKRQQISDAALSLSEAGQAFSNVTKARQAVMAHCKANGGTLSINTIRKHDDLINQLIDQGLAKAASKV